MTDYTLSFVFDPDVKRVLLIQKNRPAALAGNWNGIGGKIEENEDPSVAAARELMEEAGIECDLRPFARVHIDTATGPVCIYCYYGIAPKFDDYKTLTDELVRPAGLQTLTSLPLDPDAAWLLLMAKADLASVSFKRFAEVSLA